MVYLEYDLPLHCFAFACPPVLSLDLAHKVKDFITTVVLNDDIICRMSWGSLEDLKKIILNLMSQTDSNTQRFASKVFVLTSKVYFNSFQLETTWAIQ